MNIQPLIEGEYFHIYNRGVNGEDIFKEERNYHYFLQQYNIYCSNILETLAYALLKNHFHLVVYIKENVTVPSYNRQGIVKLNASKQLSHFFNSYAQSVNKVYKRTGPLFESPFERKLVEDDVYLISLIYYCHYNPQLHEFVHNFKDWPFTSYHDIIDNNTSRVTAEKVRDWFGGKDAFEKAHEGRYVIQDMEKYFLE